MIAVPEPIADATPDAERVLILAPLGRDSAIAAAVLREARLQPVVCDDLDTLVGACEAGAGCAVLTQEAVQSADLHRLFAWLNGQPTWSDLPIVIITQRGGGVERNPVALRLMEALGNVTFLERPFHASTLLSLVQSALRSRRRQYRARAQLVALQERETALHDSEERLRLTNETLELQVAERTARLRASEARLRTVFETSYQAQGLLATDGTVLDANATSLAVIGATLADVAGQKYWRTPWFSATPGMPERVRAWIAAAARGDSLRREITLHLPGGARTYDLTIRPIRDETGAVAAIVPEAADITLNRQAEETLRQAQKMEAIGQLTGGIAHDFNNMLQGISSGIELMRKRIAAGRPEEADRFGEAARQSIVRAAALTHRLLAFSRRQALAPRRVDVDALVSGMAGLIGQTVGPEIAMRVELVDGSWPVVCDPNQLENALLNLAINARDAMLPAGGDLVLRTAHATLRPADLVGWADARPGDHVRVSVIDTGTGMPPDVLRHAFEPFFTTKPAGQGTGLGLSQVFGFISQSKGLVRIESQVGKGTSVHLYLPRQAAEQVETPMTPEHAQTKGASLAGATVLLVEDEADIRGLAAASLRDLGCRVIEAKDGTAGLTVLRTMADAGATGVDMLVTDVGLPGGLNGRQLADAARELAPRLPVLLITGFAGEALGPDVQLAAGMELLTKPFTLEALAARVATTLAAATTPPGHEAAYGDAAYGRANSTVERPATS